MKISQEDLTKLQKIKNLFEEIEGIYEEFDYDVKEQFREVHNYDGSLGYCIRWGLQAAEDLVEDASKETKSLLEEFKEYCYKTEKEAGEKYSKQHIGKYMVYDGMWDSDRDDCNMYARAAEYLIDEHPEWFDDCETIEDCDDVLQSEYESISYEYDRDDLDCEKSNLSYGQAILEGTVIEVGSIGRWNGSRYGLNILEPENIGELLTSNCEQWMCYVDKKTGEFCLDEYHHDGSNHYRYRELKIDKEDFEEMLEDAEPGEMDALVEKHSKSIGPRVAAVYGWQLNLDATIRKIENEKNAESLQELKCKDDEFER